MPAPIRWTTVAAVVVAIAVLAGLVHLRRVHLCRSFALYLLTVAVSDLLQLIWPERFFTWDFWVSKEAVLTALKLLVAVELSAICFAAFPGAVVVVRRAMLMVMLALLGAMLWPTGARDSASLAYALIPRVANGTAFVFVTLWAFVLWYRIPVHALHLSILKGFVPYLVVFTLAMRLPWDLGGSLPWLAHYLGGLPYIALLFYWTWAAWRPESALAPDESNAVLRRLQPWRRA